jgi:hypothetical protein
MKDVTSYDGDLMMFRETPKPIDIARLGFWRWLVEHGRVEHLPAGPSSGELTMAKVSRTSLAEIA